MTPASIKIVPSVSIGKATVNPLSLKNKTQGLLFITGQRVLHYHKPILGETFEQMAIDAIASVDYTKKQSVFFNNSGIPRLGSITKVMEFELTHDVGEKTVALLSDLQKRAKNVPPPMVQLAEKPVTQKMQELKQLLDSGFITSDEFENKRQELLKSL